MLKVYIAGKITDEYIRPEWRADFCRELSKHAGIPLEVLDPAKDAAKLNQEDAMLMFGQDCSFIKRADVVIVNLTDDISVGGSQEMLIAKYFKKPLIGIAQKGGKFRKRKIIAGKEYADWMHAFVAATCDAVVEDVAEAAIVLKRLSTIEVKDLSIISQAMDYYEKHSY